LVRKLERLEDLGYIEPRYPLAADGVEDRSSYQIADPYFRFWFRYVANNRSRLERGRVQEVRDEILADLENLMGSSFEQCCRRWLGAYVEEERIGVPEQIGSWWSRNGQTEVDVVGVRKHRYMLLGSCKWRRIAGVEVLEDLYAKQNQLGPRADHAQRVLFAPEDFSPELRARAAKDDVMLVTAADLFG
jgi:uncharacterized protein